MKNYIHYLGMLTLAFIMFSCSLESKMKKIAETSVKLECPLYKFETIQIVDTITIKDYNDSIENLCVKISDQEYLIKNDSNQIKELIKNQDECRYQKRRTLSWLRSTYDRLISDYDDLIMKYQKNINKKKETINQYKFKIEEYERVKNTKPIPDSIIFYISLHQYDCGGGTIDEYIYFDTNLEIYKKEYTFSKKCAILKLNHMDKECL